ncbi:MAG: hypothetical protein Q8807_03805, partial ['Waltheria sp.' little leaf phytoplasma]|nr:hypothetical protein ['Waltheria sp.' little leaf phytoplasma]
FSFGVPLGNINEDYQNCYTNTEIAEQLNLSLKHPHCRVKSNKLTFLDFRSTFFDTNGVGI